MTVDALKDAITRLPECEREALTGWLNHYGYDQWDRQMATDFSVGGRGIALLESVRLEVAEGKASSFEQGRELASAESSCL